MCPHLAKYSPGLITNKENEKICIIIFTSLSFFGIINIELSCSVFDIFHFMHCSENLSGTLVQIVKSTLACALYFPRKKGSIILTISRNL